ncbi:MAG TPA: hypothetical protein VK158_02650 [Acidobacteriota bacterium]|nr:hypothetical protein [Acidobacteriota bacterium]
MRLTLLFTAIVAMLLLTGCTVEKSTQSIQEIMLTTQEITDLQMTPKYKTGDVDLPCVVEESDSSRTQYALCGYTKGDSEIIIELAKYNNLNDLNDSYQYASSHLINSDWLIQQDAYGDMSKLQKWNESSTFYYHFYIVKDMYMIHVTSKGVESDQATVVDIGKTMLDKIK